MRRQTVVRAVVVDSVEAILNQEYALLRLSSSN